MTEAIFLDRDGTLILDRDYLARPEGIAYYPGALEALRAWQEDGFALFIVTNQSGIGRGYFSQDDLEHVQAAMIRQCAKHAIELKKIYVAPEAPEEPSRGRKPSPQFLFDAAEEFGIDLARSYMIGDKQSDLECGWKAGVRASLLVRTGNGRQTEGAWSAIPPHTGVVDDLTDAVRWIRADRAALTQSES